tara:strand:+ start:165 stop:377 length:213 start_codon:yes stop_codon:yes gene_type:complete
VKHVAMLATEITIARSVPMTSASDVPAKTVEIKHYVEKIKEHEARRASFNERMEYWKNYHDNMDRSQTVD